MKAVESLPSVPSKASTCDNLIQLAAPHTQLLSQKNPGANCQYRYVQQRLRSTGLCNIPQSDADKRSAAPNFAPFRQKSLGDCSRPLLPTQGWLTSLTKNGHVPNGLMDIQHPAVLDDHPVVSALSQLSTCHQEKTFEKFIPYGMSSYPVQKWYNFIPSNCHFIPN